MTWRIYYGNGSIIEGNTREEWERAPSDSVQVVVLLEPPKVPRWFYIKDGINISVRDRQLWTGDDTYDPFGWGIKLGTLIPNDQYSIIWRRACGDS